MPTKTKKQKQTAPSVLAFERKISPSDGTMFQAQWKERYEQVSCRPNNEKWMDIHLNSVNYLAISEKSVRGTISNRLKPSISKDPLKLNAEIQKPNLQRVDSCSLSQDTDTLVLKFTAKVLGGLAKPSSCNSADFAERYKQSVVDYMAEHGCKQLAMRYLVNIVNARALWRNRIGANKIETVIKYKRNGAEKELKFDSISYGFDDVDTSKLRPAHSTLKELADLIASVLRSDNDHLLLDVTIAAKIGAGQEVFPSEELVLDKSNSKNKKSKILYSVNGVAAMHSQKIGNAIRTIDTWYDDFGDNDFGAIAVEVYGAVTNFGIALRNPRSKTDFYTLFNKFVFNYESCEPHELHYVVAVLIRGGVFGESSK